jgi:hypothetical protein
VQVPGRDRHDLATAGDIALAVAIAAGDDRSTIRREPTVWALPAFVAMRTLLSRRTAAVWRHPAAIVSGHRFIVGACERRAACYPRPACASAVSQAATARAAWSCRRTM